MKSPIKTFFVLLVISTALITSAKAQLGGEYYKSFKFNVDFSYGSNTGALTAEPHYRLSDLLAVGVRAQVAAVSVNDASGGNPSYTSYCLTGEQYLASEKSYGDFRFFAGAGAGTFMYSATGISKSTFGYFPRIGFEASHFRAAVDYNFTGNGFNYLQIGIGFFLGGGKK
jgi:hypothetical protein